MVQFIQKALNHKGMGIVEIMTNCHTYYGRYNAMSKPEDMLAYFKKNTVQIAKSKTMTPEELKDKIVAGEFVNIEAETYSDRYKAKSEQIIAAERGEKA
jgi:2-oxoglutarate ferredoxin oxidoreductase subunit beta